MVAELRDFAALVFALVEQKRPLLFAVMPNRRLRSRRLRTVVIEHHFDVPLRQQVLRVDLVDNILFYRTNVDPVLRDSLLEHVKKHESGVKKYRTAFDRECLLFL